MHTPMLTLINPAEMGIALAGRLRALRLHKGWTRETLAKRAGVSGASLKRFETSGKASLELVLKVAQALDRLEEFNQIFQAPPARSIAELEERARKHVPMRGRL